jgi:hypothetical protein
MSNNSFLLTKAAGVRSTSVEVDRSRSQKVVWVWEFDMFKKKLCRSQRVPKL